MEPMLDCVHPQWWGGITVDVIELAAPVVQDFKWKKMKVSHRQPHGRTEQQTQEINYYIIDNYCIVGEILDHQITDSSSVTTLVDLYWDFKFNIKIGDLY